MTWTSIGTMDKTYQLINRKQ